MLCEQTTKVFPCSELLVSQHSQILASAVTTSKAIDMAQKENKTGKNKDVGISAKHWSLGGISELISDCFKFISLHLFDASHYLLRIFPQDSSVSTTLENSKNQTCLFLVMQNLNSEQNFPSEQRVIIKFTLAQAVYQSSAGPK